MFGLNSWFFVQIKKKSDNYIVNPVKMCQKVENCENEKFVRTKKNQIKNRWIKNLFNISSGAVFESNY